jgi:2,3-bisphosphoglycerate-dependent phosphoglycerate mutase
MVKQIGEKKKLHIYLFRHGQTYNNKNHVFTGWKDSKLTSKGIKDAKSVAAKLKNKKIDVAYHSGLGRSINTLKEILKFHHECKSIIKDKRIMERSYGELEGKHHTHMIEVYGKEDYEALLHAHKVHHLHGNERKEFEKKVGEAELQVIRRSYYNIPKKGESVKMVEKRVESFIKDLIKKMKHEKINVCISAHGNSMRPFRKHFEKLSVKEMMKLENPWDKHFEYTIYTIKV